MKDEENQTDVPETFSSFTLLPSAFRLPLSAFCLKFKESFL